MNPISGTAPVSIRAQVERPRGGEVLTQDQVALSGQLGRNDQPIHFQRQSSDFLDAVADHTRDTTHLLQRAGVKDLNPTFTDEMSREQRKFYEADTAPVVLIQSSLKDRDGLVLSSMVGKLMAPMEPQPNLQMYVQALVKEAPERRFFAYCDQRSGLTGVFELIGRAHCRIEAGALPT